MRYPLATGSWDDREREAILRVIDSDRFTMGSVIAEFEQQFAEFFGTRHAVMSNPGSSANLLAVAATLYQSQNSLQPGDEVIVPVVSWGTTYFPLQQHGLKLKFVDVSPIDFNLNLDQVETAIGPNTKAVFAVNLLGVPCDFTHLTATRTAI
ncbi:MAG: aminotransferase class I/II-fold pyridoxal phosphate-dependent enzyme [Planctomycetales bacterium]|jgi:CDP-6-deoxy-D-xylo-4-hexulose-3-dehydrase